MGDGGLDAVLQANRGALLRFLSARGGVDAEPDELLQDLWLRVQSAAPTGPIAEPLAYLCRIANNMMHDRRRAARRRGQRETAWAALSGGMIADASDTPSAERALLARDELVRMEAALDALGERTATVLRRYRLHGESQKVIATDLGISLSAVEKHLQRAYRGLAAARADEALADIEVSRRHPNVIKIDAAR